MKTLVHQYTNLDVFMLSHRKPAKIVTNGRDGTVPFPLLDAQQRSAVAIIDTTDDEGVSQHSGIISGQRRPNHNLRSWCRSSQMRHPDI